MEDGKNKRGGPISMPVPVIQPNEGNALFPNRTASIAPIGGVQSDNMRIAPPRPFSPIVGSTYPRTNASTPVSSGAVAAIPDPMSHPAVATAMKNVGAKMSGKHVNTLGNAFGEYTNYLKGLQGISSGLPNTIETGRTTSFFGPETSGRMIQDPAMEEQLMKERAAEAQLTSKLSPAAMTLKDKADREAMGKIEMIGGGSAAQYNKRGQLIKEATPDIRYRGDTMLDYRTGTPLKGEAADAMRAAVGGVTPRDYAALLGGETGKAMLPLEKEKLGIERQKIGMEEKRYQEQYGPKADPRMHAMEYAMKAAGKGDEFNADTFQSAYDIAMQALTSSPTAKDVAAVKAKRGKDGQYDFSKYYK